MQAGAAIAISFDKEMKNCFEQRLTGGKATYFRTVNYLRGTGTFEAIIFHNPESPQNFRRLFVDTVLRFQSTPHDTDGTPNIEGIIGVHQETKAGYFETTFHTDLREMTVTSREPLVIEEFEQGSDGDAEEAV